MLNDNDGTDCLFLQKEKEQYKPLLALSYFKLHIQFFTLGLMSIASFFLLYPTHSHNLFKASNSK